MGRSLYGVSCSPDVAASRWLAAYHRPLSDGAAMMWYLGLVVLLTATLVLGAHWPITFVVTLPLWYLGLW